MLGKKQVAQLEFADYVVGISIGSIAAQMAVDPEIPFYHFLIAMAIYGFLDLFITLISRKANWLKSLFKGKPLVLIDKGEIDYDALKKSKLDLEELQSLCRIKGYFDLSEIHYCLFEPSGEFSILPKNENMAAQKKDLKVKQKQQNLSVNLVVDGRIQKQQLKKVGVDALWVLKKAKVANRKQLKKQVVLLTYEPGENSVCVFKKKSAE